MAAKHEICKDGVADGDELRKILEEASAIFRFCDEILGMHAKFEEIDEAGKDVVGAHPLSESGWSSGTVQS